MDTKTDTKRGVRTSGLLRPASAKRRENLVSVLVSVFGSEWVDSVDTMDGMDGIGIRQVPWNELNS